MIHAERREFLRLLAASGAAALAMPARTLQAAASTVAAAQPSRLDDFWAESRADGDRRRALFLEFCAGASPGGRTGLWSQIARLELHRPIDERPFREGIDFIYSNSDCNDFTAAGLLRILYRFPGAAGLPPALRDEVQTCLLKFKYWWDEPGRDERTYHTENHQIIFHANQLLAGELWPDALFTVSGRSGREQAAVALPRVRRWLEWRIRFGFSEWLSHCYFEHEVMALANLRDFAAAPDIRARAEMLIDVLLFEIALHSHRGVMGSTHGRTYTRMLKSARGEGTSPIGKLMFGLGVFNEPDNMGALALATSSYQCPQAIVGVTTDADRSIIARERHSLNVESAAEFGLSCEREEDVTLLWSVQDYVNPLLLDASERISRNRHVRNFAADPSRRENYGYWRQQYQQQVARHGRITAPWQDQHAMGEVHLQTCRGPGAMISCAQDYRPGIPGYQQHIWQATLGPEAIVFTNNPGSLQEGGRPDFWAGNSVLPRAAQHGPLVICVHRVPPESALPFSHAYFPRAAFDEIVERRSWIFGRKGDGFIALYSRTPTRWLADALGSINELRAEAPDNVWVCEVGSGGRRGFATFIEAITAHEVQSEGLDVRWISPSAGAVSFGWSTPLQVRGVEVPLHNYPRFDNPYCQARFLDRRLEIRNGERRVTLDFQANIREIS